MIVVLFIKENNWFINGWSLKQFVNPVCKFSDKIDILMFVIDSIIRRNLTRETVDISFKLYILWAKLSRYIYSVSAMRLDLTQGREEHHMHTYTYRPRTKTVFSSPRNHCLTGIGITPIQPLQCNTEAVVAGRECLVLRSFSHLK